MKRSEVHLLCTGTMDRPDAIRNKPDHIIIDIHPFIRTVNVEDENLEDTIRQVARLSTAVIFTSRNAVRHVVDLLDGAQPLWTIFCIGKGTRELINACFKNSFVQGVAENAALLSEIIVNNNISECVFFCGKQRLDDLPRLLKEANTWVQEVVVYNTLLTPVKTEKKYDGILFFSPSAVESFFSVNSISGECVLFALGDTTARQVRCHVTNKLVVSTVAQKAKLAEEAIVYFEKI